MPLGRRRVPEPDSLLTPVHMPSAAPPIPNREWENSRAGPPSRSTVVMVTSYASASRTAAAPERTDWPPPVAVT